MFLKEKNGIQWLEFELFADIPHLVHGIFLRPLDLSLPENFDCVKETLKLPTLYHAEQVHGINIAEINADSPIESPQTDALVTEKPNLALMIKHADCQAAIFYDQKHHVIANVHCGWRGNVQNIYEKVVQRLQHHYDTDPKNLLVGISPSLGPDSAEFKNYQKELPKSFWKYQTKSKIFDFWTIAQQQLIEAGVPSENIEIAQIDTYENEKHCFSFRKDKTEARHGTIVSRFWYPFEYL